MRTTILCLLTITTLAIAACSPSVKTTRFAYITERDTVVPRHVTLITSMGEPNISKGRIAYATGDSLWITRDGKPEHVFALPRVIALLSMGDTLAVGTAKGFFTLDLKTMAMQAWEIPARDAAAQVNALAIDKQHHVWVATNGYGLFQVLGNVMQPFATAPYISSIAVTPDSGIWAGSNVGLFRIFRSGEIKRYYEETSNGISIPDNIIEHMQCDARGNLWIFASKAVTILRPEDYRGLSPTGADRDIDPVNYAYLGSEGNSITKFFQRKGHHNIWWALSAEGLLALSNIDVESEQPEGMPDIPQAPKGHLEIVTSFRERSGKTIAHFPKPNDITFDESGNLWLATDEGIWEIASETLDNFEQKFLAVN